MLMHNPIETPKISDFAYLLTPGRETRIEIIPRISSSTPDLVNIPEVTFSNAIPFLNYVYILFLFFFQEQA